MPVSTIFREAVFAIRCHSSSAGPEGVINETPLLFKTSMAF
jgi:hypothetical protein